jgi:type IV secretory pathway VirB2 component (pilin)
MNQASNKRQPFLQALCGGAAATVIAPSHCWAAGQAILPWDYTLNALQNFIAGPFAHSVIVISAFIATVAFTLAGDNELARRIAKTAIGTGVALLAVQLLNYLTP